MVLLKFVFKYSSFEWPLKEIEAWAEPSLFELINVANLYSLPFEEGHFTNLVNTDQTVSSTTPLL